MALKERHEELVAGVEDFTDSFYVSFHWISYRLKSFSTFAFTAASILINGGHGLLNPSPASLRVASIPSFVPIAISLVAWSSTSAGPLVKMLSRCGSVLADRGQPPRFGLPIHSGHAPALLQRGQLLQPLEESQKV